MSDQIEKRLRSMMLMSGALVILSMLLIVRVNRSLLTSGGHGLTGSGIGIIVPIALVSLALFITSLSRGSAAVGDEEQSNLRRTRIIVVLVAFLLGMMIEPIFDLDLVSRAPRLMGLMLMSFPLVVIGGVISSYLRRR